MIKNRHKKTRHFGRVFESVCHLFSKHHQTRPSWYGDGGEPQKIPLTTQLPDRLLNSS